MDYKQLLEIVEIVFWIAILLSCLLALLRGRVFAIQFLYLLIFFNIFIFIIYFQNFFLISALYKGLFYIQTLILIILIIITLVGFNNLSNRYLFWGVNRQTFLEAIHNILHNNNFESINDVNNSFRLKEFPEDIYSYNSFLDIYTASYLYIRNNKKSKVDQCKIVPILKSSLQNYSMNLSGKVFLIIIILFSSFMLWINILHIM